MIAYFSLFVLLTLCLSGFSQKSPKLALLIGISDYPAESGWTALHTERDIEWLQTTLEKQGFAAANIRTLQNEQATHKGIQQAFQQLLASAKKDATVVIHFSGHGQQLQDEQGDELDGLDEAWVPYDSPMLFEKEQYEGERLLRDDAIDLFLTNLRQKIGPKGHVLITVDACHSGTSTRGFGTARGTDIIMADSQFYTQSAGNVSAGGFFGIGFPLSGGNSLQSATFFLGGSLFIGTSERVVLTAGLLGGRTDELAEAFQEGDTFISDASLVPTREVY